MRNPCWTCVTSALDINFPGLRTTPYCSKAMVSVFRSGFFVNTPPHHAAVRIRNIWSGPILILFIISLIPYRVDTIRSSGAIALLFPHSYCLVFAGRTPFSSFPRLFSGYTILFYTGNMASSHTDLEMVTVRGVTFLIDPSIFVEGCTYLLVGSGTVEPFDSVPIPSAALLLNLGRGGSTPEERHRSLQVGDLLLGTMGQSQFVCDVPSISAYLPHLVSPLVSSILF